MLQNVRDKNWIKLIKRVYLLPKLEGQFGEIKQNHYLHWNFSSSQKMLTLILKMLLMLIQDCVKMMVSLSAKIKPAELFLKLCKLPIDCLYWHKKTFKRTNRQIYQPIEHFNSLELWVFDVLVLVFGSVDPNLPLINILDLIKLKKWH